MRHSRQGYLLVTTADIWRKYRKQKDLKHPVVEYKLYKRIIEFMFKRVWYYLLAYNWIYTLPNSLGRILIREKNEPFYVDWRESAEKRELRKKYNLTTDGKMFTFYWDKTLCRAKNATLYKYDAYRGNKKEFVGTRGIKGWVDECAKDPLKSNFRGYQL